MPQGSLAFSLLTCIAACTRTLNVCGTARMRTSGATHALSGIRTAAALAAVLLLLAGLPLATNSAGQLKCISLLPHWQVFEDAPEDLAALGKQGMKGVKRSCRKNGKVSSGGQCGSTCTSGDAPTVWLSC